MSQHECGNEAHHHRRDPEDSTPLFTRRHMCGVALGGLASYAFGVRAAAAQSSPRERLDAADAARQDLIDARGRWRTFADDDAREPHVVVLGIDGLRPDALQIAATPNIDWLVANGTVSWRAFAGGNPVVNEQVTSSGPGWSAICTGVWTDRNSVESNAFLTPNYMGYPHFFQRILEQEPDMQLASIVNWEPINDIIVKGIDSGFSNKLYMSRPWTALTSLQSNRQRDLEVGRLTAALVASSDPAVTFIHLDACDGAGHATAFAPDSPEYMTSIQNCDAVIGTIRAAVDARPNRRNERWAYVLTTDHGGLNNGHGGQTVEERKIPFIVGGDGVPVRDEIHGPGQLACRRRRSPTWAFRCRRSGSGRATPSG